MKRKKERERVHKGGGGRETDGFYILKQYAIPNINEVEITQQSFPYYISGGNFFPLLLVISVS